MQNPRMITRTCFAPGKIAQTTSKMLDLLSFLHLKYFECYLHFRKCICILIMLLPQYLKYSGNSIFVEQTIMYLQCINNLSIVMSLYVMQYKEAIQFINMLLMSLIIHTNHYCMPINLKLLIQLLYLHLKRMWTDTHTHTLINININQFKI